MLETRSAALLELPTRINCDLAGAQDLKSVLQRLLRAAARHVGGERGSIVAVDDTAKPVDAAIVCGKGITRRSSSYRRWNGAWD